MLFTVFRPTMRDITKSSVRPVSDGYALGKTDWSAEDLVRFCVFYLLFRSLECFVLQPPPPAVIPTTPPASYSSRRPISYVSSTATPNVIGAQEIYNDPRNKREATIKR